MIFWTFVVIIAAIIVYKKFFSNKELKKFLKEKIPQHFAVIDLETSGLDPAKHEIIEIGVIVADTSKKQHITLSALIKPTKPIPLKITEITGITQEMLDTNGQPIADALESVRTLIGDLPVIAYNSDFDLGFLKQATKLHLPHWNIKNKDICALKLARSTLKLKDYKLQTVCKALKIPQAQSHRALDDAKAALEVYLACSYLSSRK